MAREEISDVKDIMKIIWIPECLLVLISLISCTNPSTPTQFPQRTLPISSTQVPNPNPLNQEDKDLLPTSTTPIEILGENQQTTWVGYTHQRASGNRVVAGFGRLPDLNEISIPLPATPAWVVAIPWEGGSYWAVTLDNGQVLGFQIKNQIWIQSDINPDNLDIGQPPLLTVENNSPKLLIAQSNIASSQTHPVPILHDDIQSVFLDTTGNLIGIDQDMQFLPPIIANALPDSRILIDDYGRVLFLSNPTEIYNHGVLGDSLEAKSVSLVNDLVIGDIITVLTMGDNQVIEGIAPIWTDLDADGIRDIILTVSTPQHGSQILVFSDNGQQIASGPAIGQGYRWRHQIAVAPFGSKGELEIVSIRTPHLGGVVEFFRLDGNQLKTAAQLPGYSSHIIGSRNLDMAAVGDFDGDGNMELLVPNQSRIKLAAIRRTDDIAEEVWSLPLDAPMSTNLGAVTLSDGEISVGVGMENGILRIWHP